MMDSGLIWDALVTATADDLDDVLAAIEAYRLAAMLVARVASSAPMRHLLPGAVNCARRHEQELRALTCFEPKEEGMGLYVN